MKLIQVTSPIVNISVLEFVSDTHIFVVRLGKIIYIISLCFSVILWEGRSKNVILWEGRSKNVCNRGLKTVHFLSVLTRNSEIK